MGNTVCLSGLKVKLSYGAKLPTRNTDSAAYDLYTPYEVELPKDAPVRIDLGIRAEIPYGYFGRVQGIYELAYRTGVWVLGGVLEDEWKVIVKSDDGMWLPQGSRIAQVVFLPYGVFDVREVDKLGNTERAVAGFGSSGL